MGTLSLAARCRLDSAGSQRVFRVLLDALARPGRPSGAGLPVDPPRALLGLAALGHLDTSFSLVGAEPGWEEGITLVTGARAVALEEADLVAFLRPPQPDELRSLRRGRADAPERGARVWLACDALRPDGPGRVVLALRGPGVSGVATLGIDGLPTEVFETLASVNGDFPMGVDTWLSAPEGYAGLPRSCRVEVAEGRGSWATPR